MKNLWVLLTVTACLSGCGVLFKSGAPAATVYTPSPQVHADTVTRLNSVLVVGAPEAGPGLDSDYLMVSLPGQRLDHLAGVRWSAPVPELLQAYWVHSLDSGGWRAVVSDRSAFAGTYLLQTQIRSFTAVYRQQGQAPVIRVALHAQLGRSSDHVLLANIDAVSEVQASADRQTAIVQAFDAALAAASLELGSKAYQACAAADALKAPAG